jgi:type II secretory pathway pseudopilin PulG
MRNFLNGQTLIEVLVAMTVGVLVLTAITSSVLTSIVNSRISGLSQQATQYAQEGLEIARASRDAAAGTYCLGKGTTLLTGIPDGTCTTPNVDSTYIRSVAVLGNEGGNDCGTGVNKTVVTVKWKDAKCSGGTYCHQVALNSCASVIAQAGTITPTPTMTPTPTPFTDTLSDYGDDMVDSGAPTANHGNDSFLDDYTTKNALFKFDTAGLAGRSLVSATLQLSARLSSKPVTISEADNDWTEGVVTYNTKPDQNGFLGTGTSDSTTNHFLTVDVTSRLQDNLGYPVSFFANEPTNTADYINAREHGTTTEPKLTVITNSASTSLHTPSVASSNQSSCTSCSSLSYAHTPSGSDRFLIVSISYNGTATLITGVTFAGQTLTQIPKIADTRDNVRTTMWYLFNPPTTASNVVITASAASASIMSSAVTIQGVATQYPVVDEQSNWTQGGSPLSTPSIYAVASDLIISAHGVACGSGSLTSVTPVSGQTAIQASLVSGLYGHLMTYKSGPSTTVGASWVPSTCFYGSAIGVSIRGKVY